MRRRWLILALTVVASGASWGWGQQGTPGANGTAAKQEPASKEPVKVGSYSLVVTSLEPSTATHWLNPAPTIAVKGGTKLEPAETSGSLPVPQQFTVEAFGTPRHECEESAPKQHGCDALDRTELTIRDQSNVEYRIVSHGGAVQLRVNLQVHDLLPVSHGGANTDWHAGDVIFVSVPKGTPAFRFVSETLVGNWNGEAIVFEPGKALPAGAKKGLEDLGIHQDMGDSVLYSYRVKAH